MKYRSLRDFMKKQYISRPYEYAKKALVIDGLCLKDSYKTSNCQFILGGEYDRFASSLKEILTIYIESGIQCYVVFSGAGKSDMKTRKYVHQKIIDKTNAITPGGQYEYCEPILVKEVYKDVLDELGIQHYTCMYGSKGDLFHLARQLECPILTISLEYVLYGVSVIPYRSVKFNENTQSIRCSIYLNNVCRRWCQFSDDLMSVVLTIADEDSSFYEELLNIFSCESDNYIPLMMDWVSCQTKDSAVKHIKSHLSEENQQVFMETFLEIRSLFTSSLHSPAMDFLIHNIAIEDRKLEPKNLCYKDFEHDIGFGRIAQPFINLKTTGTLSGSWAVYNKDRDDAMMVAIDIALYAQALLRNTQEVQITFIGRKSNVCEVNEIKKIVNIQTQHEESVEEQNHSEPIDHFQNFIKEHLPGFDLMLLESVPKDSWILLISLLYYNVKTKSNINEVIHSIILSYVLLGPVSKKIGLIEKSNFYITGRVTRDESTNAGDRNAIENNLTYEQCSKAAGAVINMFYIEESILKNNFDRDALHTLSEFQYCLQFINYLNKLCGKNIKCTAYHKTINCTFIYNLYIALKGERMYEEYIEKLINCTPVYLYFKNILDTYYKCLSLINCDVGEAEGTASNCQ